MALTKKNVVFLSGTRALPGSVNVEYLPRNFRPRQKIRRDHISAAPPVYVVLKKFSVFVSLL